MLPEYLDLLWRCADCPEAIPILTADELAGFSHGDVGAMVKMGMLRPAETARHVTCRDCSEDHTAEVERVIGPGRTARFYAVCPGNGRVEIPRERLLQWRVDFGPVLTAVMSALGAAGSTKEVVCGRVWDLGRAALAGQSRPVLVLRGMSWKDAAHVAQAVPKGRSPVVLFLGLAPESGVLTVPSDSVIDLRTVIHLEAGALTVDASGVESQVRGSAPKVAAKKVKKRASRATAIDAIKQALRTHILTARDHAFATAKRTDIPELLPRPTEQRLAEELKLSVSAVSRAISDRSDVVLPFLWKMALDVDQVMQYKG